MIAAANRRCQFDVAQEINAALIDDLPPHMLDAAGIPMCTAGARNGHLFEWYGWLHDAVADRRQI